MNRIVSGVEIQDQGSMKAKRFLGAQVTTRPRREYRSVIGWPCSPVSISHADPVAHQGLRS